MDNGNQCTFPAKAARLPPKVARLMNLTEGMWTELPASLGTDGTEKMLNALGHCNSPGKISRERLIKMRRGIKPNQSAASLVPHLQSRPSFQAIELTMRSEESSRSSRPEMRSVRSDLGSQTSFLGRPQGDEAMAGCGQGSSAPSGASDRPGSSWMGSGGRGSSCMDSAGRGTWSRGGSSCMGSGGGRGSGSQSAGSQGACPRGAWPVGVGSQGVGTPDAYSQGACSWNSGPRQDMQQGSLGTGSGSLPPSDASSLMGAQETRKPIRWASVSNDASCSGDMLMQQFVQQDNDPFINDASKPGATNTGTGNAVATFSPWASVGSCVGMPSPWANTHAGTRPSVEDCNKPAMGSGLAAPGSAMDDSSEDSSYREPSGDEDDEIIIGPTQFAVQASCFEDVWIPAGNKLHPVLSRPHRLFITDVIRLSGLVEDAGAPLSFGSLLHICGHQHKCRPCMFERVPGRCRKLWLCDFCHLHVGRKRRSTQEPSSAVARPSS
mmetsp:Transcript_103113/g.204793  ORF Transcript_103113/g.204793 Transcript_103113/m.204793 type:complete len:494 (+) Transcript_103113:34-1515(+)